MFPWSKFINSLGLEGYKTFANFILIKVKEKTFSKNKIISNLLKNKIIVRDLESYGLNNFFRVSIGTNHEMNKFMKILKKIITELKWV